MADAEFVPDQIAEDQDFIPDDPPPLAAGQSEPTGFVPDEVDTSAMKSLIKDNVAKSKAEKQTIDTAPKPVEAEDWLDSLAAGWGFSVAGLIGRGENSPLVTADNAGTVMQVATQVGMLAGDLPAMAGGSVLGGLAMTTAAAPLGPAAVAAGAYGSAAGAFMLPTAMRKIMMDHYDRGDIATAEEFWNRLSSTTFETLKSGVVGVATAGAGRFVGPVAGNLAKTTAEIGAMVSVGKALEGELPNASDFINAGILVGGMHVAGAAPRMREIFRRTGEKPEAVLEKASQDVILKQELLADNSKFNPDRPVKVSEPKVLERTDAEKAVLGRVGKPESEATAVTASDVYTQLIDDLNPIKKAVDHLTGEAKLPDAENPYILSRLYKGWGAKLERVVKYETVDFKTGKATGEGLLPILKDIPNKDREGFVAYALSKRAIEKSGQGIETGVPLEHAQEVVKTGTAKYEDTFRRLNDFQSRVVDYAVDSGLLDKSSAEAMRAANKDYIPFQRLMDENISSGVKGGKLFEKMEGSERQILDPLGSVYRNTEAIIRNAERNKALQSISKLQELKGGEEFVKPVGEGSGNAKNQFSFFENGKRQVWEATPELAEAMKALDNHPGSLGLWGKIAKPFAATLRAGITLSPDFIVRNVFRDQLTASVQSKYSHMPFMDVMSSLGSVIKKDEAWREFLSSGGASAPFGEIARHLDESAFGIKQDVGVIKQAWNVLKSPLDGAAVLAEMSENITRLSEYKRAIKAGASNETAAFNAREITVDFARAGAQTRAFSALVPFANVAVQGTDRTFRAFKENPVGTGLKTIATISVPTLLNWYANKDDSRYKDAPNWEKDFFWLFPTDKWEPALNDADALSRPDDLRRPRAGGGWEVNNGTVYKLPKPFEVGLLFGSLLERTLDTFYQDNPQAIDGLGETMVQSLVPFVLPAISTPVIEQMTNRSFFTGNPIVNSQAQKSVPAYQYTEYTSETAKQLGKLIGHVPYIKDFGPKDAPLASPMVIDNYIQMWSGTLGKYIVQLAADPLLKATIGSDKAQPPASTVADIPFVKSFISRYPKAQAQPIIDFENQFREASQITNTVKMLVAKGDMEAAQRLMDSDPWAFGKLTGIHKSLQSQRATIFNINERKDLSPTDKRQLIDAAYYQMATMANMGNKMAAEYKKQIQAIEKQEKKGED